MASLCCCLSRTYGLVIGILGITWSLFFFFLSTAMHVILEKLLFFKFGMPILMVGTGINIVASFMLLLGLCTENHRLLLPWLINNALLPCLLTVGFVMQWLKSGDIPSGGGILAVLWIIYGLTYLVYKEIEGSRGGGGGGGGYSRGRSPRVVAMQSQTMNIY